MFTTIRDVDCVERDAIDKAWEWRREADDKRDNAAPVGGIPSGIPVHAVEVIHVGDRHVPAARDVVASHVELASRVLDLGILAYSVMRMAVMGPKKIV